MDFVCEFSDSIKGVLTTFGRMIFRGGLEVSLRLVHIYRRWLDIKHLFEILFVMRASTLANAASERRTCKVYIVKYADISNLAVQNDRMK